MYWTLLGNNLKEQVFLKKKKKDKKLFKVKKYVSNIYRLNYSCAI